MAGNGESDGEDVLHLNEGGARRKKRAANGEGGVKTAVSMVNVIGTWVPPCYQDEDQGGNSARKMASISA